LLPILYEVSVGLNFSDSRTTQSLEKEIVSWKYNSV